MATQMKWTNTGASLIGASTRDGAELRGIDECGNLASPQSIFAFTCPASMSRPRRARRHMMMRWHRSARR